jgi:(p)ppGpp synthase/HD superfamily hydrolase
LHPQERALVVAAINERGAKHDVVLADTLAVLKRTLQEDTHFMGSVAHASFAARAKPPYSVWRKLVKLSRDAQRRGETGPEAAAALTARLDQVLDHLALRVVFDVVPPGAPAEPPPGGSGSAEAAQAAKDAKGFALCYHVLGLVHAQWGRGSPSSDYNVKDYVSQPKANGYQSLHTTCTCRLHGQAWPFEVQVRTQAMHRVAEWGKAAHAAYKQQDAWTFLWPGEQGEPASRGGVGGAARAAEATCAAAPSGKPCGKRPWPRTKSHRPPPPPAAPPQPLAPDTISDAKEYATWLHGDLRARRVLVFVTGGATGAASILDLEQGCSLGDALRRATNRSAASASSVRVNGGRVDANYTLRNGDAIVVSSGAAFTLR